MEEQVPRRRESDRPRGRLRKGMYILPSLFTTANIAAGFYAILQTVHGSGEPRHMDYAAMAIGFAVLFDGLDGRIARMTHTDSDFGKELDSLADVITFGVAPALLAWMWGFHLLPAATMSPDLHLKITQLGSIACFAFLMAGASRLARFNIAKNPQPSNPGRPGKKYFVGMPIPAGAGVIAAIIHYSAGVPVTSWVTSISWLMMVVVVGYLMVSTWRFWSGKEINFSRSHPFQVLVLVAIVVYVVVRYSTWVMFGIGLTYMFSGIWARAAYGWSRRRRRRPIHAPASPLDQDAEKHEAPRFQ